MCRHAGVPARSSAAHRPATEGSHGQDQSPPSRKHAAHRREHHFDSKGQYCFAWLTKGQFVPVSSGNTQGWRRSPLSWPSSFCICSKRQATLMQRWRAATEPHMWYSLPLPCRLFLPSKFASTAIKGGSLTSGNALDNDRGVGCWTTYDERRKATQQMA